MIALLVAAIFRVLTPVPPEVPQTPLATTNILKSRTTFAQVTYTGPTPDSLPGKLILAQITGADNLLTPLIKNLRLIKEGSDTWKNDQYNLAYEADLQFYILDNQALAFSTVAVHPDLAAATTAATNFLTQQFGVSNYQAIPAHTQFLSSAGHFDPVPESEATAVKLVFAPHLGGVPIVISNSSVMPIELFIDGNNQVRKVFFFEQIPQYQPLPEVEVFDVPTAITQINQGQAAIIAFSQQKLLQVSLKQITSAQLTKVFLEYRSDPNSRLLVPYYRFVGTAVNDLEDTLDIELITPAVVTKKPAK